MKEALTLESLFLKATDYTETHVVLFKLKAVEKVSKQIPSIIWRIVVATIILLATVFTSIGVSLWIGTALGQMFYGFLIMGAVYLLTGLVIYFFRESIIQAPLSNAIIKSLLK